MFLNNIIKKFDFEKFTSFILLSLPLLLITGNFLPDFAVSFSSLLFIIYTYKKKLFKYYKSKFFIIFIIFCFYLILCSLFSKNIFFSLHSSLFYFRLIIFSLLVWYLLEKNSEFILKNYFYVFSFIIFFFFIDGIHQLHFGLNIFNFSSGNLDRVSSFFGDELIMGSYFSRLFPLYVGLFFYLKENRILKFNSFFFIILCCMVGILILISGERTSFIFFIFSIILLSISNFRQIRIIPIVVMTFLVIFYFFKPSSGYRTIEITTQEVFKKEKSLESKFNFFFKNYMDHYKSSYKMFLDNKFLGKGPRGFRYHCDDEKYKISKQSCTTHPHNTYFQLLSETGIFGFVFVFSIFLYIVYLYLKMLLEIYFYKKKSNILCSSILVMFLVTLFPLAPSGNFFHNWLVIIYYLPVGFYLWLNSKLKSSF